MSPYGRQKLTGREVSTYFRRNPVKDAQIKKAVEVALDLQGAMTVASKEIKKFYGDKILRSKEVQKALKYANESVEHDIREDLQEVATLQKSKTSLHQVKKKRRLLKALMYEKTKKRCKTIQSISKINITRWFSLTI